MSALARYFKSIGKNVAGYDLNRTKLTEKLESEGINIHYKDNIKYINPDFLNRDKTLIVYTPAVPDENSELKYFRDLRFVVKKRSEVLGMITNDRKCIGVAGTHGKTTVTTMIAHIFNNSKYGCSAFLGGISKNYDSNLLIDNSSENIVVEADEYDRSFLKLNPEIEIITSVEADHLDIYSSKDEIRKSYVEYIGNIKNNGHVIVKYDSGLKIMQEQYFFYYTYSFEDNRADFYAKNIRIENNQYIFDIVTPVSAISDVRLAVVGKINIENAVAAAAAATVSEINPDDIKNAIESYRGVKRRFDIHFDDNKKMLIDDYAHHPTEVKACLSSLKEQFDQRELTLIFQPHLYSRTRDFAREFGESLSLANNVVLLDIYAAREKPIEGVNADLIFKHIASEHKVRCTKDNLIDVLKTIDIDILITMGAGDIDTMLNEIKQQIFIN